jgi:hypothetical protein
MLTKIQTRAVLRAMALAKPVSVEEGDTPEKLALNGHFVIETLRSLKLCPKFYKSSVWSLYLDGKGCRTTELFCNTDETMREHLCPVTIDADAFPKLDKLATQAYNEMLNTVVSDTRGLQLFGEHMASVWIDATATWKGVAKKQHESTKCNLRQVLKWYVTVGSYVAITCSLRGNRNDSRPFGKKQRKMFSEIDEMLAEKNFRVGDDYKIQRYDTNMLFYGFRIAPLETVRVHHYGKIKKETDGKTHRKFSPY